MILLQTLSMYETNFDGNKSLSLFKHVDGHDLYNVATRKWPFRMSIWIFVQFLANFYPTDNQMIG